VFEDFEAEGRTAIAETRIPVTDIRIARSLDMRYVGQEHLVTIPVPVEFFASQDRSAIKRLFDAEHEQRYGTSAPAEPAEIASLRTAVTGILAKPKFERIDEGSEAPPKAARRDMRDAFFAGHFVPTPTFDRTSLLCGNRIEGPALIEEHASTTVLMPGDVLSVDEIGNLVIDVGATQ
jgi:N-methylhydantoinase A